MNRLPTAGIRGIGLDIIEIERVRRVWTRRGDRFLRRVFSEGERAYCERARAPWRHYAGRFAVKEAVGKAFGTGIGEHVRWRDIEVVRNPDTGAPSVVLHGAAHALAQRCGVSHVLVSLSHGRAYAVGQAMLMADDGHVQKEPS